MWFSMKMKIHKSLTDLRLLMMIQIKCKKLKKRKYSNRLNTKEL